MMANISGIENGWIKHCAIKGCDMLDSKISQARTNE